MPAPVIVAAVKVAEVTQKHVAKVIPGGWYTIAGVMALVAMLVFGSLVSAASGAVINYIAPVMVSNCQANTIDDLTTGSDNSGNYNTTEQKTHAQGIINAVAARKLPERAAVIALITALQESGLRMYANAKVPGSLDLPHSAVGSDGYSVGLFQQQVHGSDYSWGTVAEAMNVQKSADMFLDRLVKVPNWTTIGMGEAAQTVQVSAFPDAYDKHITTAKEFVSSIKPTTGSYGAADGSDATGSNNNDSDAGLASTLTCNDNVTNGIGVGSGKGDDYPFSSPKGDCAWCSGSADPGTDAWGYYKRECVSFVAWRMNQQMGSTSAPWKFHLPLGNAATWGPRLQAAGYKVDDKPKVGSIAWWGAYQGIAQGDAGHVAVVTRVNDDGTVDIEQYNANPPHAYSTMRLPSSNMSGFIHVADKG